jgi:CDP-glucose 4,6-dehydratase
MGANVIGYALKPPTQPNLFQLANVQNDITHIEGDICHFEMLKHVIANYQPEIVIHMAAQALVRHSYQHPVETYATNVMGTVHLFEAIRAENCVKVIVNVTSDKCYENKEWPWAYRENEPLGGYDPYSNSKGCAELVTQAYRSSYFSHHGPALASARAGNVIGGGDWAKDRLITDIFDGFINKRTVVIRNPKAIRPWQHVLEPLSGYLMLAERLYSKKEVYTEAWNFGPVDDDIKEVTWIIEKCAALWPEPTNWEVQLENNFLKESHSLKLDCSKAKLKLGWRPRWNLARSLQKTVEWFSAYARNYHMRQITLAQLDDYLSEESTQK